MAHGRESTVRPRRTPVRWPAWTDDATPATRRAPRPAQRTLRPTSRAGAVGPLRRDRPRSSERRGEDRRPCPLAQAGITAAVRRGAPVPRRRDRRLDRRPAVRVRRHGRGGRAAARPRRGAPTDERAPALTRGAVMWLAVGLAIGGGRRRRRRDLAVRPRRGRHARPARLPAGRRSGRSSRASCSWQPLAAGWGASAGPVKR